MVQLDVTPEMNTRSEGHNKNSYMRIPFAGKAFLETLQMRRWHLHVQSVGLSRYPRTACGESDEYFLSLICILIYLRCPVLREFISL